ncbi:hypothetical protein Mesau_00574 [Mesorhizobium australicum WSM2073]|uniref:Uncharacterized protein n=1 Tax=Mesorhizobium australicum (strain HAMBI 3006 / LMG 24608 / WSM2073) TaxID=754035 RepID=L0KG66_MESAW|nr:hypothetical protein [Mesorhizobium australicum]AGB43063.1 hypothetical protein Mesau_00574 [Mesorhizobium australicum WSM2073]
MKSLALALACSVCMFTPAHAGSGTIAAVNDDHADLFVSIWDLNTADNKLVWDKHRLNDGQQENLAVELDGDRKAKIKWTSVRTDGDPPPAKTEPSVGVNEGDSFYVNTF